MYTSFFGLNEKPFTITPDPRYLFMSERHGEGLAHLVYGVTESGGFIQLTGEVGTGKTTLVRTLLGQIPSEVDIALILNPQLTALEFLTTICEELGISLPADRNSTKAMVDSLNRHLLEVHSRGRRIILLIDEAQNLSEGVLEQLRLLTNLETARQKLLQIILIAQPELREKLAQESLRQLAQRVTGRYHLEPLSKEESFQYIDHRLRVAGALTEIFDSAAKREVFRLSGGVPRVMNVICDRALLGAYSSEVRTVNRSLVRKAASEVSGQKVRSAIMRWIAPTLGAIGVVLAASLLWSVIDKPGPAGTTSIVSVPLSEESEERMGGSVPEPEISDEVSETKMLSDAEFERLLANYADGSGFKYVLNLWGIEFEPGQGSACQQAEAHALRCFHQRGTWSMLRQLDRPVILSLTGEKGVNYQAALAGLTGETAYLATDDGAVRVPIRTLSDYWFGQFILFWRPANNNDAAIGLGMKNDNVRWLRQSLAELNSGYQPTGSDSDLFDAELEQQLMAFQRKHKIEADGLAGQKTQIIINSLLVRDDTPRLSNY